MKREFFIFYFFEKKIIKFEKIKNHVMAFP